MGLSYFDDFFYFLGRVSSFFKKKNGKLSMYSYVCVFKKVFFGCFAGFGLLWCLIFYVMGVICIKF